MLNIINKAMETKKQHGNTGKKNALKPEDQKATSYIMARCLPADKALWVKKAQSEKLKLTDWIIKNLNNALRESGD